MKRSPISRKTPLKSKSTLRQRSGFKRPSKDTKGATDGPRTRPSVDGKGPPYRGSKIRQRSKKREVEEKEYSRLRKEFLTAHPKCYVCQCRTAVERVEVRPSTEVHHKAGRGKFYLRVDTWLPVCRWHHEQITNSRGWAEGCGFSLTKAERRAL